MKIKVNGDEKSIDQEGTTISDLLQISDVENPDLVSVQLNGEFVDRKVYNDTSVAENDEVDFLYFMGGGSL